MLSVNRSDFCMIEESDSSPDSSYLTQDGWEKRLAEYRNGDFYFVGIYASVDVEIAGVIQTIRSAGLWGIESDSDKEYIADIFKEECAQLADILADMNIEVID